MKTSSKLLAAFLLSLGSLQSQAQNAVVASEPVMVAVSTVGETNALIAAVNDFRAKNGLRLLVVDAALSARAAAAFPEVVNAPGVVDVTALRKDFRANEVAVLRGIVTHRGEKSGGEFPKYWAKDPQWAAVMAGDFTHLGAATVKRRDGKLVAFIYLIKR